MTYFTYRNTVISCLSIENLGMNMSQTVLLPKLSNKVYAKLFKLNLHAQPNPVR